jgi:hypothetical protein
MTNVFKTKIVTLIWLEQVLFFQLLLDQMLEEMWAGKYVVRADAVKTLVVAL